MKIIFCEDTLRSGQVDEVYQREADAASALNLHYTIVNFEALVNDNDPIQAVRQVATENTLALGIYRGWMLSPYQYAKLYTALDEKGIRLINDPSAYQHCHYLPDSYSIIEPYTPKSVWLPVSGNVQMDEIMNLLNPLGSRPVIVKDYVKSQKHYWHEACFIPSAEDKKAVEGVVQRFLELQSDTLNEGLVFREFIEFEPLTTHSKSKMPLSKEFRVFVLDGEPLYLAEYWEEGDYQELLPQLEAFREVMRKVKSRFYTMDIAKQKNGGWLIVELGDAQVSGLPDRADVHTFYKMLNEKLTAKHS